jgi:hypothetical protein
MITITSSRRTALVHAAAMLAGYLAEHTLPEPASLSLSTIGGPAKLTAQLRPDTLTAVAAELLAWADTLHAVTVQVWRLPEGERVHLSIRSSIAGPAGAVELTVYGAVPYDPHLFPDLQPHSHRGVALPLEQLLTWAGNRDDR